MAIPGVDLLRNREQSPRHGVRRQLERDAAPCGEPERVRRAWLGSCNDIARGKSGLENKEVEAMHAARIHSFGSSEALKLDDVPTPEPQHDEILVKVRAASVNP